MVKQKNIKAMHTKPDFINFLIKGENGTITPDDFFYISSKYGKGKLIVTGTVTQGEFVTGEKVTIEAIEKPKVTDVIKEIQINKITFNHVVVNEKIGICLTTTTLQKLTELNE